MKLSKLLVKVGLPPSKESCLVCFNESPLKMMKNAFYFILTLSVPVKLKNWIFDIPIIPQTLKISN